MVCKSGVLIFVFLAFLFADIVITLYPHGVALLHRNSSLFIRYTGLFTANNNLPSTRRTTAIAAASFDSLKERGLD